MVLLGRWLRPAASVHRLIAAAEPREAAGGLGNNAALRNVSGNKSATKKQQQHVSVESVQNLWCTAHKLNLTIVTREPICFFFFFRKTHLSSAQRSTDTNVKLQIDNIYRAHVRLAFGFLIKHNSLMTEEHK